MAPSRHDPKSSAQRVEQRFGKVHALPDAIISNISPSGNACQGTALRCSGMQRMRSHGSRRRVCGR
jgi:hypothetical protein